MVGLFFTYITSTKLQFHEGMENKICKMSEGVEDKRKREIREKLIKSEH